MAETTLEQRVSAVEQEVEGEKLVTRHILDGDNLAAMRAQLGRIEQRQDGTDREVRSLRTDFGALRTELAPCAVSFRRSSPTPCARSCKGYGLSG